MDPSNNVHCLIRHYDFILNDPLNAAFEPKALHYESQAMDYIETGQGHGPSFNKAAKT